MTIAQVLKLSGLTASTSEALRMIDQGGVRIDGSRIDDKHLVLAVKGCFVLQVGKRKYARVSIV
jgi:tyrosyl-tRNA synthetase